MSTVTVRQVNQGDIVNMMSLIRQKAEFDGCLQSLRATEDDIRQAFFSETPKAMALVACIGEQVIGLATYFSIYSTFIAKPGIWLDDLFICQEQRKSGAGKALIKALCSIAKKSGCGRIDWIVATDNTNGISFYQHLGANISEDIRHARLDENAIENLAD